MTPPPIWMRIGSLFASLILATTLSAAVIAPSLPKGLDGSKTYKVSVNGERIPCEGYRTAMDIKSLPEWFTKGSHVAVQQEVHFADFQTDGPLDVVIATRQRIKSARVRPYSKNVAVKIEGKRVRFSLPGPGKVYVEIDDLPPLCLFANPMVPVAPAPSPDVIVFGPGVHKPGYLTLKDNQTVYLAPGAIVYGGLRASGVRNLHIYGGGILDGAYSHEDMVKLEDCENVRFEGVTIRNGVGWTNTLVHCRGVSYRGVKVISFGPSGDGIDPLNSQDVIISDSFFRCTDDCVAIKAPNPSQSVENIRVFNNVFVGFAYADGVTIGYETNAPSISDIQVYDCDVIQARGGSRVNGHSGFSIICDGPSRIHDVLFRDIRVEDVEFKLFELNVTDGTLYGEDKPGYIGDVTIKNVSWAQSAPIVLKGFAHDHKVSTVVFEGCTVAGKPLVSLQDPVFQIGPHVDEVVVAP